MYRMITVSAICLSWLLATRGLGQESSTNVEKGAVSIRSQANAAYDRKDYKSCANLFEQSASAEGVVNDYYNSACCYGRDGNVNKAFELLESAVKAGYRNLSHVKFDSDLEILHTDARWKKLLATIVVPPIRFTDNITTNPAKARFVYDDLRNFLHAMTLMVDGADPTEILEKEYFAKATPGLEQFVTKYGLTAEAVAAAIKKRPEKYEQLGERIAQLKSREASMRSAFVRFKEVVPQVVFPPTYFLVADYSGIASGSPEGQLISLERKTSESVDRIETLLVHELFHFQQAVTTGPDEFYALFGEKKTLLGLTIREGAAEFVANRVTGRITQQDAYDYVLKYEREIWERFQPQMMGRETSGWMWSKPSNPDQPRDVAYALGSRIVQAYYNKITDKRKAMQGILSVIDYPRFLEESGYAKHLLSQRRTANSAGGAASQNADAEKILRTFVKDFRSDPFASTPVTFGVRIQGKAGGDWTVTCLGKSPGRGEANVTLTRGFPPEGVVFFLMNMETLQRIDRGETSELTEAGKAQGSEAAPVEVDPTPGFKPGDQYWRHFSPLRFHFWTRGNPEIVRFGKQFSRVLHGSYVTLLYYERGLRTVWMQVEKGQHVNESPRDQLNPFDSMFVITRGACEARIGGVERTVRDGEMLYVPKDVTHEFWNDNDKPCEWVLLMFGPGA